MAAKAPLLRKCKSEASDKLTNSEYREILPKDYRIKDGSKSFTRFEAFVNISKSCSH